MIRLKRKEILNFTFEFSILINQNFLVQDALSIMTMSTLSRNLLKLINNILRDLKNGLGLSDALEKESLGFGNYYIASVKSGEESGNLGKSLENIYRFLEKQNRFESKLKSASFYPIFVLTLTFAVVIALISYIVPSIVEMTNILDTSLPVSTLRLINGLNFLKEYGSIIILLIALVIFLFKFLIKQFKYSYDSFLLTLPYLGEMLRKREYLKFFSELSLLVKNNIPIEKAVLIAEEALSNLRLKEEVELARHKLMEGYDLSESLSSFILKDSYLFALLRIGEESNRISENLNFTVDVLEREIEERRERILKSVEPIMLVVIGAIILVVVYNLYLPILNMLNKIDFTNF